MGPQGTEEPPGGGRGPTPPPLSRPVARGAASGPELQRKGMPGSAGAAAPRAGLVRAALGAAGAAARARAGSGRASQRGCAPPLPHNSKACQAGSRLLAPGSAPGKKKKKRNEKKEKASEGAGKARRTEPATHAHSPRAHPGDGACDTRPSLHGLVNRSVTLGWVGGWGAVTVPPTARCELPQGLVGRKASPRPGS